VAVGGETVAVEPVRLPGEMDTVGEGGEGLGVQLGVMVGEALREGVNVNVRDGAVRLGLGDAGLQEVLAVTLCDMLWEVVNDKVKLVVCV